MPVETFRVEITERLDEDTLVFIAIHNHLQAEGATEEQALERLRRRISADRTRPRTVEIEVEVPVLPETLFRGDSSWVESDVAQITSYVMRAGTGISVGTEDVILTTTAQPIEARLYSPQETIAEWTRLASEMAKAVLPKSSPADVLSMARILNCLSLGGLEEMRGLLQKHREPPAPKNPPLTRFEIDPSV